MNDLIDISLDPYLRSSNYYSSIEKIGSGSYGTVELVKDKNGNLFAKKNIIFQDDDDQSTKYFMREVHALLQFRFNGLPFIRFEGFSLPKKVKDEKIAFIVTDYIKGGSLSDLIDNKYDDCEDIPTTKMIIIYGISFALKLMHKRNTVHRDLKPDNILLNERKEPVLADFGFARMINRSSAITMTRKIGTMQYMAPEIIEDDDDDNINNDCSIDVYSFGVLLLEIISCELTFAKGKDPFDDSLEPKLITHFINGKRYDLPGEDVLPEDFKELIENCWAQNPSKRLTMKDVNKKLKEDELTLPGCNLEKYHEYVNRLSELYNQAKSESKKEEEEEGENTPDFPFDN